MLLLLLLYCYYNPYGTRRRYRPPPSLASLVIAALFWRCISAACLLIFSTAWVSGNPMSQYPGGVGARSHCARCRDTAWRCALTPAAAAEELRESSASLLVVVESHSDGTSVGDVERSGERELHRGASSRGGSGPTAAYHYTHTHKDRSRQVVESSRGVARTSRHSSHSPAPSPCRCRRPRTTSLNANGTPAFAAGSTSNSALIGGGELPRARLYREIGAAGADAGVGGTTSATSRRGRFVGGGECGAGACWGAGEQALGERLLVRSRCEGVEGYQNVSAGEEWRASAGGTQWVGKWKKSEQC